MPSKKIIFYSLNFYSLPFPSPLLLCHLGTLTKMHILEDIKVIETLSKAFFQILTQITMDKCNKGQLISALPHLLTRHFQTFGLISLGYFFKMASSQWFLEALSPVRTIRLNTPSFLTLGWAQMQRDHMKCFHFLLAGRKLPLC